MIEKFKVAYLDSLALVWKVKEIKIIDDFNDLERIIDRCFCFYNSNSITLFQKLKKLSFSDSEGNNIPKDILGHMGSVSKIRKDFEIWKKEKDEKESDDKKIVKELTLSINEDLSIFIENFLINRLENISKEFHLYSKDYFKFNTLKINLSKV